MAGVRPAEALGEGRAEGMPTSGQVREYLSNLARGAPSVDPAMWSALSSIQVIGGGPDRPAMTPVAERLLRELDLRAYRVDSLPLGAVTQELATGLASIDVVAERAEYFIAELGPVPPVEVLPYLRIVAASLAGRPEPAEDLVADFKNAWGSMEVLGGAPDDRLLAAELITASGVDQGSFYSPMMNVVDRLRSEGSRTPVTTGVLLELRPSGEGPAPLDAWIAARRRTGSDEAAALLTLTTAPDRALENWDAWSAALQGGAPGGPRAAAYLAQRGPPSRELAARVQETAALWRTAYGDPALAAAVAVSLLPYSSGEVVDWVNKAVEVAQTRQLAPARGELAVIGLALLRGGQLPGVASMALTDTGGDAGLAAHVALHAWLFRDSRGPRASG